MSNSQSPFFFRSSQTGLSLVELLVAMLLSFALLGGVITMFTSSKGTYEVNSRLARIEETGRFAMMSMVDPVRQAGYFGCTNQFPIGVTPRSTLNSPAGYGLAANYLQFAVMGFDYTGPGTWSPALDTTFVQSPADNGDVLVIHYPLPDAAPLELTGSMASSTGSINVTPYPAGNAPFQNNRVLMIANCVNQAFFQATSYDPATGVIQHAVLAPAADGSYLGNASADLQTAFPGPTIPQQDDGGPSIVVPMQSIVFYLRNSTSGNGKSLWRRVDTNAAEELVEGIDAMQIQFGIDTDGDGQADQYVDPSNAAVTANPQIVASVSIALLISSIEQYGTIDADTKDYDLFNDGTVDFTAPGDHRLRQIITTTATLRNYAR